MSGASEVPAIPEDVRKLADDVASTWRGLSYPSKVVLSDDVAGAIMADRRARPVDTGREKALEAAVRHLQDHFPGAAMEFDVIYARALANPENGRG